MFSRGRGGPRQTTPANVQCQKCLKRGHYSYECKAPAQERPYIPRPSRTQQLLNPKLVPKLTNDVLDAVERKKGVADEQLAKIEAERAKKRELDEDDEPHSREPHIKRQRSDSVDSVSSISTRSSMSPPPRRRSPSPRRSPSSRHVRDVLPDERSRRSRSMDSNSDGGRRVEPSPVRSHHRRPGRMSRSPPGRDARGDRRSQRDDSLDRGHPRGAGSKRSSSVLSDKRRSRRVQRQRSRSPQRSPRVRERPRQDHFRDYRSPDLDDDRGDRRREPPKASKQPEPPRERSLSPFSKRLALTQAMNS